MSDQQVTCFIVEKQSDQIVRRLENRNIDDLPGGDVLLKLNYSAVNYKDGLASQGHPGVALNLPLVPGIDGVGFVVESQSDRCRPGDQVMVTGADFGTKSWGGWSTYARVPGDYCIPVPPGMTGREAAIIGTAGFTAAYSVEKLMHHGVKPDDGPVLVTGATGGVGVFAVRLLCQLGYHVVAATGKSDKHEWLLGLGASEIIGRQELADDSKRPLLSGRWAGAVDTVGGAILETTLRATRPGGCVTACGLVAGHDLDTTVYPFILRGISLQGIDSANASLAYREYLWNRLASDLAIQQLDSIVTEVPLEQVESSVEAILNGQVAGRHLIRIG